VEQVDFERDVLNELEYGSRKKDKPFAIVLVIDSFLTINTLPIEVIILTDKVDRHITFGKLTGKYLCGNRFPSNGYLKLNARRLNDLSAVHRSAVSGHHQADLVPQFGYFSRECTTDIRQSAGLGERDRLTRGKTNVHAATPKKTRATGLDEEWMHGFYHNLDRDGTSNR
jgi:hypothetical protein